mgnify:CR=1 FL=1
MSVPLLQLIETRLADHKPRRKWLRRYTKRSAVALILQIREGELNVLMIKRAERKGDPWSGHMAFPGGRMDPGDDHGYAVAVRETEEEVGLTSDAVEVLAATRGWLRYRLPKRFIRKGQSPVCIGQKQKWYLLRLLANDADVRLDANQKPEFDHWQWVSYWYPLNQVVAFKREVYRRAMKELAQPLGRHTAQLAGD